MIPSATASSPVVVRDSRDDDLHAIHAIYAHHVRTGLGSFEEVPPDVEELRHRRAAILADRLPYLVAEIEGRVAGYAYAGRYRPRSAYRFSVEDSIYVAPDVQRRGVGRLLLLELIERWLPDPMWRYGAGFSREAVRNGTAGLIIAFPIFLFLSRLIAFAVASGGRDEERRGNSGLQFLVMMVLQIVFGILASMIVAWFSRQREFRADAGGARLAGRNKMIGALERLQDRKSTRLNSSHMSESRMPSSA